MIELPIGVAAFVAGVLMFLAPCTLPLVPAYLAFIAGGESRNIVRNAVAFVLGFGVVFVLLGVSAAALGALLVPLRLYATKVAGAGLVLFGAIMLGLPVLQAERRLSLPRFTPVGQWPTAAIMGALFALGWSPCVGPILGSILFTVSVSATVVQGALLMAIFTAGLAVPFLLCAVLMSRAQRAVDRLASVSKWVSFVGGTVLILLGVLMLTNQMGLLTLWGYELFDFVGYGRLLNYL